MNYELIYDVATTSQASRSAFLLGCAAFALFALWSGWLKWQGTPLHAGVKFVGVIVVICAALSAGLRWEQKVLAQQAAGPQARTAEGAISGLWANRVRRGSSPPSYWEWEGFSVAGADFSYCRNSEQNAFNNAGSRSLNLADGMRVRVTYVPDRDGRNQIVRFELARQ